MSDKGRLRFGQIGFETSNLDKVFWPDEKITKGDLIDYYTAMADRMLPHAKGRPLSLQRFPDGIASDGFFQKDAPKHYPEWITRVPVAKKGGVNQHVVADKKATFAYLANNGVIAIHGALSKAPDVDKPDRLIFDLDPSVDDFGLVVDGAHAVREILDHLKLPTYVQTTGSRGLHVCVPIKQERTFDEVAGITNAIAEAVVAQDPDAFTIEHRKDKRGDRLLIDHFRNRYAQTAVLPYSVRPKPGAPVATPIEWDELGSLKKGGATFAMADALERAGDVDPWKSFARRARSLDDAADRLERMRD